MHIIIIEEKSEEGSRDVFIKFNLMIKLQLSLILLATLCIGHAIINNKNQNKTHFRDTMINPNLTADDFRLLAS